MLFALIFSNEDAVADMRRWEGGGIRARVIVVVYYPLRCYSAGVN